MGRTSSQSSAKKKSTRRVPVEKAAGRQLKGARAKVKPTPSGDDGDLAHDEFALEQSDFKRLEQLPREVGVMLIAAGLVGLVLPGPGTPALIAGGLVLWPGAFSKLELWLERRYPVVHEKSMKQISRFLDDLKKRYPSMQ